MPTRNLVCLGALGLLFGGALPCIAQSESSGSVFGSVLDPTGNSVANAKVELDAPDSAPRLTHSSADGAFTFSNLPSGSYLIKVQADGYAPLQEPSVAVATGRTNHLELHLAVAEASQSVEVTATPVTFDVSRTSSVINIDRDRVEELPIPSRNYLTFVLLAPQVAAANPALGQTGAACGGRFSFGGLRPGSNAVYLDGVNDDDEYSGGSRTELSPEAISDFQIVNHDFAAESGGGAGGSIDVQTRQGVDRIHGDAFVFAQNEALNGTPPIGRYPAKPNETRYRTGLAFGGPIQRDKTFYYAAGEQEFAHGQDVNDLSSATLASINSTIQSYTPLNGLTLQPSFFPTTDQETELSARIDRRLSTHEAFMARYAFTNARNVNDAFNTDELSDRSSRGSSFATDNSFNTALSSTLSDTLLNKLDFELAQRRVIDRTAISSGPGIRIAGSARFGTPYFGNNRTFETHVEFADAVTKQQQAHLVTLGARFDQRGFASTGIRWIAGDVRLRKPRGPPELESGLLHAELRKLRDQSG